jgi:hypothetical protein
VTIIDPPDLASGTIVTTAPDPFYAHPSIQQRWRGIGPDLDDLSDSLMAGDVGVNTHGEDVADVGVAESNVVRYGILLCMVWLRGKEGSTRHRSIPS